MKVAKNEDKPKHATAIPVAKPLLSGNHLAAETTLLEYIKPIPVPAITPKNKAS